MRKRFAFQEKLPTHIIGRTHEERWPAPMPASWKIFESSIRNSIDEFDLTIHAFVLMGNHFHLLATFKRENVKSFPEHFKNTVNQSSQNFPFQTPQPMKFLSTSPKILQTDSFPHYKEVYKYVYTNPVNAGLSYSVIDYDFSTLPHALGKPGLKFKLVDNMHLIIDPIRVIHWLDGPRFNLYRKSI